MIIFYLMIDIGTVVGIPVALAVVIISLIIMGVVIGVLVTKKRRYQISVQQHVMLVVCIKTMHEWANPA